MMRNIDLSGGSTRLGRTESKRGRAILPLMLAVILLAATRWSVPAEAQSIANFNQGTNESGFQVYDESTSAFVTNPDPLGGTYDLYFDKSTPPSFTWNGTQYDIANVFGIYQVYDQQDATVTSSTDTGWGPKDFQGTATINGFKTASAYGSESSLALSATHTPVGDFTWGSSTFPTTDHNIYWGVHLTYYNAATGSLSASNNPTAFFYFWPGTSIPPHIQSTPEPAFYQMGGLLGMACIGGLRRRLKLLKFARAAA